MRSHSSHLPSLQWAHLAALCCLVVCSLFAVSLRPFTAADHATPSWSLQDYSSDRATATPPVASISPAELSHLSSLSYLAPPAASGPLAADIDAVVGWIGTITQLDMDQFEPMYTPLEVQEYYTHIEQHAATAASTVDSAAASPSAAEVSDLSCASSAEALRLRPDAVTDGGIEKQVLANAAYKHRGFFVVPKVVDLEDS